MFFFMFLSFEIVLLQKFHVFTKKKNLICHRLFVISSRANVIEYMIQNFEFVVAQQHHICKEV
jgi:hypothetical protein